MIAPLRSALRPAAGLLRSACIAPRASPSYSAFRYLSTRFTTDHEWVKFDPATNEGTVGVTDYAQKALGDVVFVELPQSGTEIAQGDSIGAVESVKAASDIYAPVSGIVTSVNEALGENPGLLNKSPQADGWLCKIKLSDPAEFETLLDSEAYKAHCSGA
ncbi:glycine dehydrogenase [Dioszegia hungarica]|uniref:Glycine cleavage system H protein n=1 Tax=Dioszegia hungarica TaxID=4972 RepID=A0AA38H9B8_9TREE|nr:glycine dehydrogenase [Dioszegia hungarica]KAI9634824.1 glycine dehydrogenase [Dioszegia hungarica]